MRTLITGVVLLGLLGGVMTPALWAEDAPEGDKDRIRGKEDSKAPAVKDEKAEKQALIKALPTEYRHPASELDLNKRQLTRIGSKHENYQLALKRDDEQFRQRYKKLAKELDEARTQHKRSEMRRLQQRTWELTSANARLKERRYIDLQKSVMQELTPEQKKKWPPLLMAGEAMMWCRWMLTKEQVQKVNEMCLKKGDKISKIKDLDEKDRMKREIQRRIYSEVLTPKQRKKLADLRDGRDRSSEDKKSDDKAEREEKPRDKDAPPGPGGW